MHGCIPAGAIEQWTMRRSAAIALTEIINLARSLHAYRHSAEAYRRAEDGRWFEHRAGTPYGSIEARAAAKMWYDVCEKHFADLARLRQLVPVSIPSLNGRLPLVTQAGCWHLHGVDWRSFDDELTLIEATALAQCGNAQPGSAAAMTADRAGGSSRRATQTKVCHAATLIAMNPTWTVARVAHEAGLSDRTLRRSGAFQMAKAVARAKAPLRHTHRGDDSDDER